MHEPLTDQYSLITKHFEAVKTYHADRKISQVYFVEKQSAGSCRRRSSCRGDGRAALRTRPSGPPHQQHLWVKPSKQLLWSPCHRREGSDLLVPPHSPLISVTRRLSWRLTGRSRRSHLKDWPVAAGFYFKIFTASGCSWRQELLMAVMILRRLSTLLINISH